MNVSNHQEHDYLRDTVVSIYKECISYKIRTQFTCIKCGHCYSCHWKMEEMERVDSERTNSPIVQKYPQPTVITIERPSVGQKAMDVYGQEIEYATIEHVTTSSQNMVLEIIDANVAMLSIMLQEYQFHH